MTKYLKKGNVQIAAPILVVAALVAAGVVAKAVRNDRDSQKVATMTEKMKTVCVGRFLIDLPEMAEYSMQGAFLDGFDIRVFPEPEEAFKNRVAERENALRNPDAGPLDEPKKLESARDLKSTGYVGKMFVFGRDTTYGFEGEKRVEFTSVEIELHAHAKGYSVNISNNQAYPDRLDWPLKLLAQVALNPGNRIPTEPGYCIDNAYFREPLTADQGERVTLSIRIPTHPEIHTSFDMTAGILDKEGLLGRNKRADEEASLEEKARTKKLAFGLKEINGLPGEQSLEKYHEHNGKTVYAFMWNTRGTKDNVFRPALELEMLAGVTSRIGGKPVGSSLSEQALLDLWHKMSDSIRVRPTESPKVSAAETPSPPPGPPNRTGS